MCEVVDIKSCYASKLPTELLDKIFSYLPLKHLLKSRKVCVRWKVIVDRTINSDDAWKRFCRIDFCDCYEIARAKSKAILEWSHIYKSLYMWSKLASAIERKDEFAGAGRISQEIRHLEVLGNGLIGIQRKSSVEYYDTDTLILSKRDPIRGDYARYTENSNVIVILSYHHHLFFVQKVQSRLVQKHLAINNVKMFLLAGTDIYYVTLHDEIYYINDIRKDMVNPQSIKQSEAHDGVMCLGYKNGCLNILTCQRDIYTVVDNKMMVFKQSLNTEPNILDVLHKYNFLEQLDWRVYFQWMFVLNHSVPEGPMRNIIVIRPYGDVFFVGTQFGVLYIYYKPYTNDKLDLFNKKPVKVFSFMERSDIPVLTNCPILQIDVLETGWGHHVFVAMPKKVVVLKFSHNYIYYEP